MLITDGIIGLAPVPYDKNSELLFDLLKEQGVIEDRVFSFLVGAKKQRSVFTIGGYNESYAKTNLTWHNINQEKHWSLNLMGAEMNNESLLITVRDVIIDTGTSLLLMPSFDFYQVIQ